MLSTLRLNTLSINNPPGPTSISIHHVQSLSSAMDRGGDSCLWCLEWQIFDLSAKCSKHSKERINSKRPVHPCLIVGDDLSPQPKPRQEHPKTPKHRPVPKWTINTKRQKFNEQAQCSSNPNGVQSTSNPRNRPSVNTLENRFGSVLTISGETSQRAAAQQDNAITTGLKGSGLIFAGTLGGIDQNVSEQSKSSFAAIPVRFLAIPGELRNSIYRFCLIFDKPFTVEARSGLSDTSLLLVNKQVYYEASTIFYQENSFRLGHAVLDGSPVLERLENPSGCHEEYWQRSNICR